MNAVVVLTPEQVEALIKRAVREALKEFGEPQDPSEPLNEKDIAAARKSLRRFGRGA